MEDFVLLLTLLVLSFIFSGYETAFFSLSAGQRERLSLKYPYLGLQKLQADRTTLLNILLLLNLLVNTLNSFVFVGIIENMRMLGDVPDKILLLIQILGFFVILLFTGEITPKVIAIRKPEFFIRNFSFFIFIFYRMFGWIIRPLSFYFRFIFARKSKIGVSVDEIISELKGLFHDVESVFTGISIIRGNVRRIMKNRRYVVSIEEGMSVEEIDRIVLRHPHSIYPVEKAGEVIATLNLRESTVNRLKRDEVGVIPETLTILEYLREVDDETGGFRVVVSEHGEYIGIATLDDLLRVLALKSNIKRVSDKVYIIEGITPIEDVESKIGVNFDTEADTLMGYIMEKTGRIPEEGERFVINDMTFEVLARKEGEIKLVRVEVE